MSFEVYAYGGGGGRGEGRNRERVTENIPKDGIKNGCNFSMNCSHKNQFIKDLYRRFF